MIRDLYAEQLDDFGKPVQGGYDMQRTTEAPAPPPVEEAAKPKTFAEAVKKAAPTQETQPSDAQIASVAKQMNQTPDLIRKMMQSDPNFAKQIGETKIEGGETPKPEAPDAPQPQSPTPPPVESTVQESLAVGPDNFLTDYGQRAKGHDAQLEDHLEKAGIFQDATPQQLSQFAEMLGIPQSRFVSTPEQLRGAILLNNAEANLRQVLTNAGIIGIKDPEPEMTTAQRIAERAKKAAGEFGGGFMEKSGVGSLKNVAKAVGRAATRGRFAATAEDDAPAQSWNTMTPLERAMYEDEDDYSAQQTYGTKEVENVQQYSAAFEAQHPRDDDGKFANKGVGDSNAKRVAKKKEKVPLMLSEGDEIKTQRKMTFSNPGYIPSSKEVTRKIKAITHKPTKKNPNRYIVEFVGDKTRYAVDIGTGVMSALNAQGTTHEIELPKSGIEMPTQEIDNKDAGEGDQLGLFEGTGKKNTKAKKFKLENEKEKAKQSVMFDRMNDHPDQKSLFSSFGEAAEHYAAQLKKK
jgi:hypothetical protein